MAKKMIDENNRREIYHPFFSNRCRLFFFVLLNYDKDKKEFFKRFYDFEKSLGCILTFKYSWMNIVNKFIVKNHISMAIFTFDALNLIRRTPLIKIYRKLL